MTGTAATEAAGILRHLQDERRHDPDQRAGAARSTRTTSSTRTPPTSSRRSPSRSARQQRDGPAGAGRHGLDREVGAAVASSCDKEGVKHTVLNARFHEREAHIVAQAGRARRGDHRHQHGRPRHRHPAWRQPRVPDRGRARGTLAEGPRARRGDRADPRRDRRREASKVLDAGGLFVLGTERHESRRIDNQLRGRSGRQGDPGLSTLLPLPRGRSAAHLRAATRCSRG